MPHFDSQSESALPLLCLVFLFMLLSACWVSPVSDWSLEWFFLTLILFYLCIDATSYREC
jgi:hypothetical protein